MIVKSNFYKINTANNQEIFLHLQLCNNEFIPRLNTIVDLFEYSNKIHQYAITFEAWNKKRLVGLVALYFNNNENLGYITNVSVCKYYMGKGIASKLLEMCINYAKSNKFNYIELEVNHENIPALNFYIKNNFRQKESTKASYIMELIL